MGIKYLNFVWHDGPRDKAELLVLLAIADYCNDDGECWPSVSSIAEKARMTPRGVQKILSRLVAGGWLEIDARKARKNCNLYHIKTPEPRSPRTPFTPNVSAETPNPVPKTPEPRSPKPSLNHQEPLEAPFLFPPEEPPPKKKRRRPEVDLPEGWVPSDKNIQDALAKGLTETEIRHEADRFRDHHHSKQSRFRDWDAAWRTWCGNYLRFRKSGGMAGSAKAGNSGQRSSLAGIVARRRIAGH